MLTVKEVLPILFEPKEVGLASNGSLVRFNFHNPLEVEAYGDYVIERINATGEQEYEIELAMRPVKRGQV